MVKEFTEDFLGSPLPFRILINDAGKGSNRVKETEQLRAEYGSEILVAELEYSSLLEAKIDYTGFALERKPPYWKTVSNNLQEIANEYAAFLRLP